jgi:trehalose 6-phosphate synthase/phosphatase
MSQVIIVSNRLPISVKKENGELAFFPSVGGLATGLSSYVNDKKSIWIGWPGIASDDLTTAERKQIVTELAKHNCSPVFLSRKQIDDFYNGYSNTVLWPLFHTLRPQDQPGERRDRWYKSYKTVNKLFAESVEIAADSDARVWVHDYQLLLVPEMLRDKNVGATIGFFLHIPVPAPKKLLSLPRHRLILNGMLGADLIGFHTPEYVRNFLKSCQEAGLGTASDQNITVGDRIIRVSDFPMGIDYEKYATAGKSKVVKQAVKEYSRKYRRKKVIVAVDRLDPSKGLVERLKAYRQFLEQYPKMIGKVVFVMVAAPSRTDVPAYQRLSKRLDSLVAEINGTYGTAKWQPVDYINRTVPFEEVTALFQIANVAFIAPLRDGMNLAAKEFVASARNNGALILSSTAGAAQELSDALIVDPRRPETVVSALHKSLTMRRRELKGRLKRMRQYLKDNTVHTWAKEFVGTLQTPLPATPSLTRSLAAKGKSQLVAEFERSHERLLLLDYDGSLVPYAADYHDATAPASLKKLLKSLGENPANDVVVISGRSAEDLNKWFGKLPINLVSEHGVSYKLAGSDQWIVQEQPNHEWKEILLPVLQKYARLTPGARVEEKPHSLVWHYRSSPPYYAQKYSTIIKRVLKPFLATYGLEILSGNKVLEIKDPIISKGKAAQFWLHRQHDFILAVGDDATDEELFEVIPGTGHTIKVGRGRTAAGLRLPDHTAVLDLLDMFRKK